MWHFCGSNQNTAVVSEQHGAITYAELASEAEKLVANIKHRCIVVCLCENSFGSFLGYAAFLNHGIVPIMLDKHLDRAFLQKLVQTYKPGYVWAPGSIALDGLLEGGIYVYTAYGYALIKTQYDKAYPIYDNLALLLTTSGTTGSPKLVRQSYENIASNTASIVEYLGIDQHDRAITTLPMNYTYGLSIINTHLHVGASIVMTDRTIIQKEFWQLLERESVTSFGGVPYTYEMLDKIKFYNMKLPCLKALTQAGGRLRPELQERFAAYAGNNNKKLFVMYGQTEATARMSYLPFNKALEKLGSIGIAIPGGCFELIDVDGKAVSEPGAEGELVYKGSNVTLGYAGCGEDLCKGDERHGVLQTGDIAIRDEDGYYYVIGRKKRFLKIFGNRISLDEIEQLLKQEYETADFACVGVDDKMKIFTTGETVLTSVAKFISEKTRLHHSAFSVSYIDAIPKNVAGKTLYAELDE